MSTFRGTPGPWAWAGNIPNDISAADGTAVCKAYGREYWQANAALIAQAPAMLDVLSALLDRCGRELADPEDVPEYQAGISILAALREQGAL